MAKGGGTSRGTAGQTSVGGLVPYQPSVGGGGPVALGRDGPMWTVTQDGRVERFVTAQAAKRRFVSFIERDRRLERDQRERKAS